MGATRTGDVNVEDVSGVAFGKHGGPLGRSAIGGAVEGFDAIACGETGGTSFRTQAGLVDKARVRIELEGDGDALVPVNAGVPQIDDARDPVAQAGKDPENQKKAQKIR